METEKGWKGVASAFFYMWWMIILYVIVIIIAWQMGYSFI